MTLPGMSQGKKRRISPKIEIDTLDFMYDTFRTPRAGVAYAVDSFPTLYDRTLQELKGTFSRQELYLIIDVFNGLSMNPARAGQYLLQECCTEISEDRLDTKWKVDEAELRRKLKTLTVFQTACMEIWANLYWYGGGEAAEAKTDLDLEKHVAVLL